MTPSGLRRAQRCGFDLLHRRSARRHFRCALVHRLLMHPRYWAIKGSMMSARIDLSLLRVPSSSAQHDSLKFEPHLQLRHFCSPYHQDSALLGLGCEVLGNHAEVWFACDSPLKGDGFELPVPREKGWSFDGLYRRRPSKVVAFPPKPPVSCPRNRWFESVSLQRRVCLSPGAAFEGREPRLSARLCAAGLATGSAETRRVFQDRANRRQYLCRAMFQYRSAADGGRREWHAGPNEIGAFRRA
jgi:hypothetical protein